MAGHPKARMLIIGVGNAFRGDDAAGLFAVRLLKEMGLDASTIVEHSGEGASLMEMWEGAEAVILIDCISSGSPPGTIHRLEAIHGPLPAQMFHSSTHAFGLPDAIEMARALNELPPRLLVVGIEGRNFQTGAGLSREVRDALPRVAELIVQEKDNLGKAAMGDGG